MNGIEQVIASIAHAAAPVRNPEDYKQDGLLYCWKCRTPKQCIADFDGVKITVGCTCKCEQDAIRADLEDLKKQERMMHVQELRIHGIQDSAVRRYTFSAARQSENIALCRRYADHWQEMLPCNCGLLFWGNVGTGKTFSAACIANAVIDKGIPALMTSFPKILNAGWDKVELTEEMKHFPLLIIDDLGVERESDYALEIVQLVVDERYKTGKPMIVTTNLTLEELKHPRNIRCARIYSRILEMCQPVYFGGESMREQIASEKHRFVREALG